MNKIAQYLNQHTAGNVFDRASICEAYSTDHSILKATPRFVALPEDTEDIRKILHFCSRLKERDFSLPVSVSGGRHSKTGAVLGSGIHISMEKMNEIAEIDVRGRLVRVQAGITLGELNTALAMNGLTIPVETDPTHTIGGLIASAYEDGYAGKYGGIYNYLDRLEVVLADGSVLQTANLSRRSLERAKSESRLYRDIDKTLESNTATLDELESQSFESKGYHSAALVKMKKSFDFLPLIFGSEGTLGIISEVILYCDILPPEPKHMFATFSTIRTAIDFMEYATELKPLKIELLDAKILDLASENGKKPTLLGKKNPSGYVVLVEFNDRPRKSMKKIKQCLRHLPKSAFAIAEDNDNSEDFKDFHNSLISYLNDNLRGERPPLLDDISMPKDRLAHFLSDLREYAGELESPLPIFGNFLTNNYSVRPEVRLDTVEGRQFAVKFIKRYASIVTDNSGSVTGGSPEGAVKALVTKYSDDEKKLYEAIKNAFDPQHILNPNLKLGATPRAVVRRLRTANNSSIQLA